MHDIDHVIGFSPLIAKVPGQSTSTVLILGSAPSVKSLEHQEYYAHPQNAFWWLMAKIFDFDNSLSYKDKQKILSKNGIIIWDVLASCQRSGSLDSQIQASTEVSNDIPELLRKHPNINAILCNGGAALRLLKKYYPNLFNETYDIIQMPSTSPAYASLNRCGKLEQWRLIEQYLMRK